MTLQVDGISISNSSPLFGQSASVFSLNDAAVSEIAFETGAISVESAGGGVRVNAIPQEGGNRFSGSLFSNFATRGMSMSNYTDELKARGLTAPAGYDKLWDESVGIGGPIRRDQVWFFAAHRYRGNDVRGVDAYYEGNANDFVYDPDFSRPVHQGGWDLDNQIRVTAQLSQRNKVSGFFDKISNAIARRFRSVPRPSVSRRLGWSIRPHTWPPAGGRRPSRRSCCGIPLSRTTASSPRLSRKRTWTSPRRPRRQCSSRQRAERSVGRGTRRTPKM
jgi:hypothetical protein